VVTPVVVRAELDRRRAWVPVSMTASKLDSGGEFHDTLR
jgi:hypothetical protein